MGMSTEEKAAHAASFGYDIEKDSVDEEKKVPVA